MLSLIILYIFMVILAIFEIIVGIYLLSTNRDIKNVKMKRLLKIYEKLLNKKIKANEASMRIYEQFNNQDDESERTYKLFLYSEAQKEKDEIVLLKKIVNDLKKG